jgi:hypothetical protein
MSDFVVTFRAMHEGREMALCDPHQVASADAT